jgi:hypothetical protein
MPKPHRTTGEHIEPRNIAFSTTCVNPICFFQLFRVSLALGFGQNKKTLKPIVALDSHCDLRVNAIR